MTFDDAEELARLSALFVELGAQRAQAEALIVRLARRELEPGEVTTTDEEAVTIATEMAMTMLREALGVPVEACANGG